jgi:hypothetical protein
MSAMSAATTVRSAASVEAASTATNRCSASEATAGRATSWCAAESSSYPRASCESRTSAKAGASCESAAETNATAESAAEAGAEATEPRAGADEESTVKPFRAVVTVRRAGVRIIIVVAVIADRSYADIAWAADPDSNGNSLRICM